MRGRDRTEARDLAFVEYVAARRPTLFRTAYLICGDAHLADDLVQTALTKAYVAWARVERAQNPDAYLRRMLINAHVDETRRSWRRERVGLDRLAEPSVNASIPGNDDLQDLWAALRGLAPGQRRVVVLRHYWGLSVDETAADLGISPGTVKSQTADALAQLRGALPLAGKGNEHD